MDMETDEQPIPPPAEEQVQAPAPMEDEEVEAEGEQLDEMHIEYESAAAALAAAVSGSAEATAAATRLQVLLGSERADEVALKVKEQTLYRLAKVAAQASDFDRVLALIQNNSSFFAAIPKAKTAKVVRTILDIVAAVPDSLDIQIKLCRSVIEWCKAEKRTFLRQRIEAKLSLLLLHKHDSLAALTLINSLLSELKKLDDKQMLADAHLTEARIHHALKNVPKAKAALTASRTSSQAIYVTPALQAELDEMAGILQVEESDYTTAYSYFLEAYDGYEACKDARAVSCLQYMILAKVLLGEIKHGAGASLSAAPTSSSAGASGSNIQLGEINIVSDLTSLLSSSKVALRYASSAGEGSPSAAQLRALEAMIHISKAAGVKSLERFNLVVSTYKDVFAKDYLISHNLERLYDKMMEENLLKIIYPYSCVEIAYVAERINLSLDIVERKLSQMILDHRFSGILDQGKGELVIFPAVPEAVNMKRSLEIIENMSAAVEALSARAKGLHTSASV